MAANEESENDQLKHAIALSLQEQTGKINGEVSQDSDVLQTTPPFSLGSLDRKNMEEERLARLAAKRPRIKCDEGDAVKLPSSKRVALSAINNTAAKITVPFPRGTVKRTWVRGYDRSPDDIKIEEVLQRDKLVLALFSSFQWDETWLLSKIDISHTRILLAAFAPDETQKQEMRMNAPKNVKFCFPPMYGPGSMHSKLQILKFSNYLRIVIPSGNLVPYDWGETGVMENLRTLQNSYATLLPYSTFLNLTHTQMVFLIDLPLKTAKDREPTETMFLTRLQHYLRAMGVDNSMIDSLSKYDFSETENIGFVYSIPGSHLGESLTRTGYSGLGTTISALGLATSNPVEVDVACASLGSIKYELLHAIYRACQGHAVITKSELKHVGTGPSQRSTFQHNLRIYFPTHETVTKSRGGKNAAGTICLQEKWWNASTFPTELMRDCVSTRDGLLMHTKIILVRHKTSPEAGTNNQVAWAYVGSANLSESAWGRVVTDRASGQKKMMCRNWECGVVLPVRAFGQGNGPVDFNVFQGTIPIPMQVPGRRYFPDEHPWFFHKHFEVP